MDDGGVDKRKAAVVGAIAITAGVYVQNYLRGDTPNLVQILTTLLLGALIGLGVAKFLNRKKQRK